MRRAFSAAVVLCCLAAAQSASLVLVVKTYLANGDPGVAQKVLTQYRAARGATPEYIEALSWLGRAEFAGRDYRAAERNASEVRQLCLEQLKKRRLDAEPSIPTALGASIEVQAQIAAAQGRRDEAVSFLKAESVRWKGTSVLPRIQKNLNLLTLEGKPSPPLEVARGLTDQRPLPLTAHRGHPVLLFFWAHWCSDCKAEIAVIGQLEKVYGPKGLVVIAPTQLYGYIAGGADALPGVETQYIKAVFAQWYYGALGRIEVPLSERNFESYGVSTTPTLVLIDAQGIVRLYNPGNLSYAALAARIQRLLR